jgi:hypothetical protein
MRSFAQCEPAIDYGGETNDAHLFI